MKRNGFTMVELIFVIIIIGILSVAAIPKFGDIKDRAKVSTEYSALSGLDGAIRAAMEFQMDDYNNIAIQWHGQAKDTLHGADQTAYTALGTAGNVLSKIVKKGEDLKIVNSIAIDYTDATNVTSAGGTTMEYDVLFIEGAASNHISGVVKDGLDSDGKPDKNDVWVFNTSPESVTINHFSNGANVATVVESGEITLIDVDGKKVPTYTDGGAVTTDNTKITAILNTATPVNLSFND